jgi:fatty acid desaturase
MKNNLEEIAFEEVTTSKGLSYADYRGTLEPRYSKVIFDIGKGYFFLILVSALTIYFTIRYPSYWWILFPASVIIGYIAAYLALFIHEAGHYNIHRDKKINDRLATFLLCLPFGLSIRSYRKIHWQHHVHLGTPDDTEISYFRAITKLFVFETLTGIHLLRTMFLKNQKNILNTQQLRESRKMLIAGILFHTCIIVLAFLIGAWAFVVAWILGFGIFFPFFATIRQVLEHRDELANSKIDFTKQPHGKISRLFVNNFLSSSFGSAGFTRHMIHHWDPQISYTRLNDIEAFLLQSDKTASLISESKTSYSSVLRKMLVVK